MSDDCFPRTMAYLVGGPADGVEQEVSAGVDILRWAEYMRPVEARWILGDPAPSPRLLSDLRVHEYRPCAETGEWLWQGVR